MIRKRPVPGGALRAMALSALVLAPSAFAQTNDAKSSTAASAPAASESATTDTDNEMIVLSPFTVEAAEDKDSYRAKSTLAGTRVRTDLNDVPSAISVVTSQFLKDTGARNSQELLVYTPSNEVGGIRGNFSGVAGAQTYNENSNLLRPNNNTRVRGLAAADNTRDYFLTEIPWDSYNVGRVDLQRGPNSILFGAGSPAGIINTSVNGAGFKNANKIENRVDQYGSLRFSGDFNYVLSPRELAIRVAAVDDKAKFEQRPSFTNDRRLFFALRWDPQLFKDGTTSVKANYETGKIMANRPRTLAPIDGITPWFEAGTSNGVANLNKLTLNPNTTWKQWGENYGGQSNTMYPWFKEAFMGRLMSSNIANYYNANSSAPLYSQMPNVGTGRGLNSAGQIDGTIGGIEFARPWAITTYNAYARAAVPGGQYFSNKSLRDPGIFDFYHKLIDGDNKREWQNWKAANVSLSQTFFNDRVGLEYAFFGQRYDDGQYAFLNGDQYIIGVDINTHLMDGSPNPNVGRAYVGNSGQYGNSKNYIDRDSHRFTAMGELRFEDFMEKSWVTRLLGRHVFTALVSQDRKRTDYRNFAHWASDPAYAELTGNSTDITNGARQIDWIAYLSGDLRGRSTASGAGLSNVSARINPQGYQSVRFFDSTWKGTVNPADAYTYYTHGPVGELVSNTGTQADNPANYVGWRTQNFRVLNAENPYDLDSLWTSGTKARNVNEAQGFTWQGYLWDGNLVPVFGWRKDKVTAYSSQAPKGPNQVAIQTYTADTDGRPPRTEERNTRSWGFVLHMPKSISDKMPGKTRVSVFYNRSENFSVDTPRGDVFGNQLPNPEATTKDYGIAVSTMNDRITLKINRYETKMQHATLQSDTAGFSSSLYYVWALPYWGATHALAALDGIATPQRRQGDWGWPWNGIDSDPARIRAIVQDFFTKFPLDQGFVDEYGLGMNVAKMHSTNEADWYLAVPTYGSGSIADGGNGASALGLQPAYNGNLKSFGAGPVADCDTLSKGYEIELTARPTDNWNLTFNASRTDAQRTAMSTTIQTWIDTYTKYLAGDAGLIKLWGGDTFRKAWSDNVLAPYSAIKAQMGSQAPEIPKWRANMISTYNFTRGFAKGFYVGGAYRWEDRRILGYNYNQKRGQLDIGTPYYGPTDEHVDMWLGYSRRLGKKVDWNIQLNVRNVTEHTKQVPVTINPDGQVALTRIQEGQMWQVTNSISF
ncbi:MAG: TonB-dependent receptor plug domain-containing protein [Nibricoccus sp.]